MTVSTTDSQIDYSSGGPSFPIPFKFLRDEDIQPVLTLADGSQVVLTQNVQYTLTGSGNEGGGTLTSAYAQTAINSGALLRITRIMQPTQETDLRNQGRYFAETHERVFDRLTMLIQQALTGVANSLSLNSLKNRWDFKGLRGVNVGDPIDPKDVANKGYVDTSNAAQDTRIDALSAGLPGTNYAFPWSTTTTTGTKTLTPGFEFASATLYINGIAQTFGKSFAVSGNQIVLAQAVPAGTEIYAILGQSVVPTAPIPSTTVTYKRPEITAVEQTLNQKIQFASIYVTDFGASPSLTDNYLPFQRAMDAASAIMSQQYNAVRIIVPEGLFRFDQRFTCKASTLGIPSFGSPGICLVGAGQAQTYLVANPSNNTGIAYFTSEKNDEVWQVQGMSLLSDLEADAATDNGIALLIESTLVNGANGFGDHPRRSVWIDDVYVGGYGTDTGKRAKRGNWKKGINLKNKWYPKITNTRLLARYGVDVTANTRTACDYAIHNEGCYSPEYIATYVHGNWDRGIWNDGAYNVNEDIEDFRLLDSFIVGPNHAWGFSHTYASNPSDRLYEPGGSIDNTHIAFMKTGITLRNHRQVTIGKGVYIYMPNQAQAQGELLPTAILLDGAADVMIDAQFLEPGFYVSNMNATVCVRIEGGSEAISIDGQFGTSGIGVLNNSTYTARQSIYVSPKLLTSRRTAAWGTLVAVVDNAGTLTSFMPTLGGQQDKLVFANKKAFGAGYPVAFQKKNTFVGQSQIAADEVVAANSAAAEFTASVVRTSLAGSNTSGAERTSLEVFVRNGGSLQQALQLVSHTGQNQSWAMLLFDVGGTLVSKRVKLGAADSAGTGFRNIFVDN